MSTYCQQFLVLFCCVCVVFVLWLTRPTSTVPRPLWKRQLKVLSVSLSLSVSLCVSDFLVVLSSNRGAPFPFRQKVVQSGAGVKPEEIKKVSEFESYAQTRFVCALDTRQGMYFRACPYSYCIRLVASCLFFAVLASTAAAALP